MQVLELELELDYPIQIVYWQEDMNFEVTKHHHHHQRISGSRTNGLYFRPTYLL